MTAQTHGRSAVAPAETRPHWTGRLRRLPLAAKLAFALVLIVKGVVEACDCPRFRAC